MKTSTKKVIIGIGLISIIAGIYSIYNHNEMSSSYAAFFIGITLIGTTYFSNSETKT